MTIETSLELTEPEVAAIHAHPSANGADVATVTLADDGQLLVAYRYPPAHFERIRRITGYLTGTLDTWNDAKRAEERDRVRHGLQCPVKSSLSSLSSSLP